jgi:hypothetical protein
VQQRSVRGGGRLPFADGDILHRFEDGKEAPHFMTVEYAAADAAVSIPGSCNDDGFRV